MDKIKLKLIYISNTRVPSEKANTYQSMVMCEAFSKFFDKVEFWYPKRDNTEEMKKITDVYKFYNVEKIFYLKEIFSLDLEFLHNINQKNWFLIQNISFSLNYILKLKMLDNTIVFTRDMLGVRFLSMAKKIKFIKQKVFFEAHVYSPKIAEIAKYIDGIVVINNYLKNLYEKDGVKNILVAHDGVKIENFKNIKIEQAKQLLNLEKNVKYITYIGRFNTMGKEKGIPEAIKALKYLDKDIKLLCVGGPLDNINFYYTIANKNNISKDRLIFIDRQPISELYKYISASSVLLMPFPWSEHYAYFMSPLKMFEYMASKRPIVASKLPSIEEVLQDRKNAILCEPDNPKDLAEKIKWCLENDTSNIVEQAYKDVQEYSWDKRAEKIVRWVYEI